MFDDIDGPEDFPLPLVSGQYCLEQGRWKTEEELAFCADEGGRLKEVIIQAEQILCISTIVLPVHGP